MMRVCVCVCFFTSSSGLHSNVSQCLLFMNDCHANAKDVFTHDSLRCESQLAFDTNNKYYLLYCFICAVCIFSGARLFEELNGF